MAQSLLLEGRYLTGDVRSAEEIAEANALWRYSELHYPRDIRMNLKGLIATQQAVMLRETPLPTLCA